MDGLYADSTHSCSWYVKVYTVVEGAQYVPWACKDSREARKIFLTVLAAFSAMRMFALSRRNWILSGLVCLLWSAPMAINLVGDTPFEYLLSAYTPTDRLLYAHAGSP